MTCIVAMKHEGNIYMGTDSLASNDDVAIVRRDLKIHRVGPFLLGFSTSFRMGQLLAHKLKVAPREKDTEVYQFMVTTFIDRVRICFKDGGFARTTESGQETGGEFLVGYEQRLFHVYEDYQVGESEIGFDSVGAASDVALGAMHALKDSMFSPNEQIKRALQAAVEFTPNVRGPFSYLSIEN